jgi:hypothetical protein
MYLPVTVVLLELVSAKRSESRAETHRFFLLWVCQMGGGSPAAQKSFSQKRRIHSL